MQGVIDGGMLLVVTHASCGIRLSNSCLIVFGVDYSFPLATIKSTGFFVGPGVPRDPSQVSRGRSGGFRFTVRENFPILTLVLSRILDRGFFDRF